MADSRLHTVYFHAGRLFNKKKYVNTKVAEIAAAAGLATGTIYNLFESKKAILTFVIRASFDSGYLDSDLSLPVKEIESKTLLNLFNRKMETFYEKIIYVNKEINCSFIELITATFDLNADSLLATGNIETNADVLPELANAFLPLRDNFLHDVESALWRYMDNGEIRMMEYPRVHVQNIMDILTWWAMNAYITMPDISVPKETAKKIAIDLLTHAYLKEYE